MDESSYLHLADATFKRVDDAFRDVDPDLIDCERAGDVITLTFKGGKRFVINTQRPTRQVWLAAIARAWHFSYDAARAEWLDDKGQNEELFATLTRIVKEQSGLDVRFG